MAEKEIVFQLFSNKRKEPNDFTMTISCSFCPRFSPVVISIPNTDKKICKTCLSEMVEFIDKAILSEDCKPIIVKRN